MPATQYVHSVAHIGQAVPRPVTDEYSPVAQPMQLVDADAPVVVRYWPAAHAVHVIVPVATAYCPVAHAVHIIELGVYEPGGQLLRQTTAPGNENSPVSQSPHVVAP